MHCELRRGAHQLAGLRGLLGHEVRPPGLPGGRRARARAPRREALGVLPREPGHAGATARERAEAQGDGEDRELLQRGQGILAFGADLEVYESISKTFEHRLSLFVAVRQPVSCIS